MNIPLKDLRFRGESMIKSKRINMIVAVAVGFALIISIGLVIAGNVYNENGDMKTETEYEIGRASCRERV